MKMAESSPKGYKTLWEKEKLLVMSNFSFSHSVFKGLVPQTRKNHGLFGIGLRHYPGALIHCLSHENFQRVYCRSHTGNKSHTLHPSLFFKTQNYIRKSEKHQTLDHL